MKVGNSVRKAIDDWEVGDVECAMLHACNAIDGTAKKLYPRLGNNARFTQLLRENYRILGPMCMPSVDLNHLRFPLILPHPKAPGGKPDLADVIYGVHRCVHGHGDELPDGFELLPDATQPRGTQMIFERGKVRLSDRVIFGLTSVAILSSANKDQRVPDTYYLSFGDDRFLINEWWGRATDFLAIVSKNPSRLLRLSFRNWGY